MTPTEMRDRIRSALDESGEFDAVDPIEGENDTVLGIDIDGELFFVKVIPA